MSTTVVVPAPTPAPKGFWGKVAHDFVVGAEKLKAAIVWAGSNAPKIEAEADTIAAIGEGVAAQIYPGADVVGKAIQLVMDKALNAVAVTGEAASANGLNLALDAEAVAAIRAALPIVKTQAVTTPGS